LQRCIFGHVSAEHAHDRVLEAMGKRPLLNLGMRLGEASGAALAAVPAKTALHLHKNMATFGRAGGQRQGLIAPGCLTMASWRRRCVSPAPSSQ
jgi:NaMN:DMB phosphoribosyltransferase